MTPFRSLSLFLMAFSVGFVACGGAVESPSPSGTTPPGGTALPPVTPVKPPATSATPTPASPPSTPPKPPPSPYRWSTQAGGCGDIFFFVPNTENTKVLTIQADRKSLGLLRAGDSVTIDLASHPANVTATIHVYQTPINGELPFCTDVVSGNVPTPIDWSVLAGQVTFTLATSPNGPGETYGVTVRVQSLKVQAPNGFWAPQTGDETWTDVNVGWYAG